MRERHRAFRGTRVSVQKTYERGKAHRRYLMLCLQRAASFYLIFVICVKLLEMWQSVTSQHHNTLCSMRTKENFPQALVTCGIIINNYGIFYIYIEFIYRRSPKHLAKFSRHCKHGAVFPSAGTKRTTRIRSHTNRICLAESHGQRQR